MSVILGRHKFATLCKLGDGSLTTPYYPGGLERSDNQGASTTSNVAFDNYPTTTPDKLVKIIRAGGYSASIEAIRMVTGPCGSQTSVEVTSGSPPTPITGSPFTNDSRSAAPYSNIFPRWIGETAWDLQTYPATINFTPQGIYSPGVFSYAIPGSSAGFNFSFDTGYLPNDPSLGGDSRYYQEAEFKVFITASDVCCWNDGAQLEINIDVWKLDFTATYQVGTIGYHDFTTGSSSYHSTMTQTLTVDPSWKTPGFVLIHTFTLPVVVGHFTFVNEFYLSSVTAP